MIDTWGQSRRGSAGRCVARNCFRRISRIVSCVFHHRLLPGSTWCSGQPGNAIMEGCRALRLILVAWKSIETPSVDQSDHRHRLLRPRDERPWRRRAGEQRDELAASDLDCHVTLPSGVMPIAMEARYHALIARSGFFTVGDRGAPDGSMAHGATPHRQDRLARQARAWS
jgi:hypothetical protein